MAKFGTLLNGRPAGREAALRLFQIINGSAKEKGESVVLDFASVEILTPSYADELIRSLKERYGAQKVRIENAETPTVRDTLSSVLQRSQESR
jgi:STAS-like domain of unknown function (DUF4325)